MIVTSKTVNKIIIMNKKKKIKKESQDKIAKENKELKKTLQQLQADFENFRKRVEIDKTNLIKYANEDLILEILPVLDNFSRALEHKPKQLADNEYLKGLELINTQLEQILAQRGLEKLNTKIGDQFDPNIHEAMESIESKKLQSGQITEIVLNGYKLRNKIIRPVKVKVVK